LGRWSKTSINNAMRLDHAAARAVSPVVLERARARKSRRGGGQNESAEFFRQSKTIVDCWGTAGVATRFGTIPDANHFTAIAPWPIRARRWWRA